VDDALADLQVAFMTSGLSTDLWHYDFDLQRMDSKVDNFDSAIDRLQSAVRLWELQILKVAHGPDDPIGGTTPEGEFARLRTELANAKASLLKTEADKDDFIRKQPAALEKEHPLAAQLFRATAEGTDPSSAAGTVARIVNDYLKKRLASAP
jgi:hypothetical protein